MAINNIIGSAKSATFEIKEERMEKIEKVVDDYITTPLSLLFYSLLFGACSGIFVYCTVTGLMFAIK